VKKILIIVAHPDDEVLGCGGTIAKLIKQRSEAYVLILGKGITSRDKTKNLKTREKEINTLKRQAQKANKILGVKKVFFFDFPDNRFDTVPLLDIVKTIEKIKNKIKPDIIFTHYEKDLNIDHQITRKAVMAATRPLPGETVKEVYSFEILSSTEWNYPLSFSPNIFFGISKTIDLKVKAMDEYRNELKKFPHPRSLKGIKLNAQHWGVRVGLKHAEAFQAVRLIK